MHSKVIIFFAAILFSVPFAHAHSWLELERPIALKRLLANINPEGTVPGTVVASPQRKDPDYYFHWTRDAALVVDALMGWLEQNPSPQIEGMIRDFVRLSLSQQESSARTGLGEPKFEVNGAPYMGDWGRPQNDGPALRAIALMRFSRWLQAQGKVVDSSLYDSQIPARSVVKRDLEYISHHWRAASFDLWEEVRGDHFYTRMVQRRALVEGAEFAQRMNDHGAAAWYAEQARQISFAIQKHFDHAQGVIYPTLNRVEGLDYKNSNLDVAVVLGVLHGHTEDGFLDYSDPLVAKYVDSLEHAFEQLYPINQRVFIPGVAIGRYPEDRYSGASDTSGNPWVLATLALAELHYRAERPQLAADFVTRVKFHANPDGSLSEQINRFSGFMTSASDLTWNYAAILTTSEAAGLRKKSVK